jgi:hypothetical protein
MVLLQNKTCMKKGEASVVLKQKKPSSIHSHPPHPPTKKKKKEEEMKIDGLENSRLYH